MMSERSGRCDKRFGLSSKNDNEGQKVKKQSAVLCMIILTLTACAFRPVDDIEESQETIQEEISEETGSEKESVLSDYGHAGEDQNEMPSEEANLQAQELYETFVDGEYAGREDYAFVIHDADGDGCKELYIKHDNAESLYVFTCVNGGLRIEYLKELPSGIAGLQWTDTETLPTVQGGEMIHSGIYVYVDQDRGYESFWYPDEEAFVTANGFEGTEPFFEYSLPDGQKRLAFYYDEATQKGCGVRYYERDPSTFTTTGMYGFAFVGLGEDRKSGILEDYLKPEVYDGSNASDYVNDFTENAEYDASGRITHYDASGAFQRERVTVSEPILWIDYEYYENGNLKSRFYCHASLIFGSTCSTWNCYFDEQSRIAHEDEYITHGSLDTYYIYMDDTKEPAYILVLDNSMGNWMPEFRRVK